MAKDTKKGNYESLKFLAILAAIFVIILIIYFISRGSEAKNPPIDIGNTPTPSASATPGPTKLPANTPATTPSATMTPQSTPVPADPTDTPAPSATEIPATSTPVPTAATTPEVTPTKAPSSTPTPTVVTPIKSAEAKKILATMVDSDKYNATLVSGAFSPNGDGEIYFRFSITDKATNKAVQPELLVHNLTGSIYCYQDGKVFDCVQFPLDDTEQGGGEVNGDRKITAQEAVAILLTYGREQLKLQSDPSNYTAQVDEEPDITLADADGIQAYLIMLFEKDNPDQLVGAYAVSENGIFVYIRDEDDPNSFIRIVEG